MININFEVYRDLKNLPEIKNNSIFVSNKFEKFHPNGLYSEQIFGPVKDNRCQCGMIFGNINAGKRCSQCGVLCAKSELRTKTFAKIKLPNNVYVINPDFFGVIEQIFGAYAFKNIINLTKYNENRENPYFFSNEKMKLMKSNKLKENEDIIEFEVFDITTLKKIFDYLKNDVKYKDWLESFVSYPEILDYLFLNDIPVLPPESRPVIMIESGKMMPHAISALYEKLITSKKNISDVLFQENTQLFGYTTYKYQKKIIEIYDKIAENNFKKKESYIREALTGKTVEFSQRSVIVPNPALKPYALGVHKGTVENIFLPELLRFLYEKFETENIDNLDMNVIEFLQYIMKFTNNNGVEIDDEIFNEFLEKYANEFKVIFERQPVLFKYNTVGMKIERVFGDDALLKD